MKRQFFAIIVLCAAAFASITLTNNTTVNQNGSLAETDTASAAMFIAIDYQLTNPAVMVTLKQGNVNGLSLIPGVVTSGSPVTISINLANGSWSATSGQTGTLSGAALTSLQNTLKGLRNTAETFATSNAIVAGSQVAW